MIDFCPAELLTTEKESSVLMLKLFFLEQLTESLEGWKQLCIRDMGFAPSSSQGPKNKGSK